MTCKEAIAFEEMAFAKAGGGGGDGRLFDILYQP